MRAVPLLLLGACGGVNTLTFEDANNYSYQSRIEIQSVTMQAGVDPCFDWSGLTTDIRGRAFDGDVDEAYFTEMANSQEETVASFEDNTFIQADVDEPFVVNPTDDVRDFCAEQAGFAAAGNAFTSDRFEEGEDWLITLTKFRDSPAGGTDPIMSLFVTPDAKSDVNTVVIADDSMSLEITALDIAGVPTIPVSPGTRKADWSAVTTDVYGNPFNNQDGNDLFVARFDVDTPAAIEDVFLTLDTAAAEIYRFDSFGTTELDDLRRATDSDGNAFSGFTRDGVWVFGVACGICNNPAPLLLGVLEVQ